jgi:hypothetical protein
MIHPLPTLFAVPLAIALAIPTTNAFPTTETSYREPLGAVSATSKPTQVPTLSPPNAFCQAFVLVKTI